MSFLNRRLCLKGRLCNGVFLLDEKDDCSVGMSENQKSLVSCTKSKIVSSTEERLNRPCLSVCGRSMVEMLGVLAIIGVLSVGGISAYATAMDKHKLNKTIDQMTQIINNIRTVYMHRADYKDLNNQKAVLLGVFPTEMIADADKGIVRNLYNGEVSVVGSDDDFDVLFEGLPRDVSAQLAATDWGLDDTALVQIKLNGQDKSKGESE